MVKIEYYNGNRLIETHYKDNPALARWFVNQLKASGNYSGTFKITKS
jgi:hypothetical protein